jgi:CDP-glucose 4,6-dehydratase
MHRYRGSRALVTGHTGFKGAWLTRWLHELGCEVHGLSLAPEPASAFHDLDVASCCTTHEVDIRDGDAVADAVRSVEPAVVFHLAAQALVRRSWREPALTFAVNVGGSVNVVDAACRTPSVRAVVAVTSDKVYRNDGSGRAFVETDALGGHDPYSASKAAAELAVAPYHDLAQMGLAGGPRLARVRAGNVIGGSDWSEDRLVPDLVRALRAGEPVTLRRPAAIRPWQHVLDCLRGYLLVGHGLLAGDELAPAYNFAHTAATAPVSEVVDLVGRAWGATSDWYRVELDESTAEAEVLRLDASLAARDLGWTPAWDLETSVRATVEHYAADDPVGTAVTQIARNTADAG